MTDGIDQLSRQPMSTSAPASESSAPPGPDSPLPAHPGASRLIGVLVAAYIVLIVGLALSGRFTFVVKTSVLPALVLAAIVTRRLGAFLRDWAPFLGFIILFDCLRGLIYGVVSHFSLPYYASYVIEWEKALFGGWTLPTLLQATLLRDGHIGAFEKALVIVHGSHFVVFLLFGLALWLIRPSDFERYKRAIAVMFGVTLVLYFAVPTAPPWIAAQLHLIPPIRHVTNEVYNVIAPALGRTFSVNPIAAMPSLHTAIPVLCSAIAWHHFRARSLPLTAYTFAVLFAIAYLGEHYYVDILAGIALAAAVYVTVYRTRALSWFSRRVGAGGLAPRWAYMRPIALGLSMVLVGEVCGQVAEAIRRPVRPDEAFVRRELVGRSDLAPLFLSRFAADRGDFAAARRLAEQAREQLADEKDRAIASEFLSRLPPLN